MKRIAKISSIVPLATFFLAGDHWQAGSPALPESFWLLLGLALLMLAHFMFTMHLFNKHPDIKIMVP